LRLPAQQVSRGACCIARTCHFLVEYSTNLCGSNRVLGPRYGLVEGVQISVSLRFAALGLKFGLGSFEQNLTAAVPSTDRWWTNVDGIVGKTDGAQGKER